MPANMTLPEGRVNGWSTRKRSLVLDAAPQRHLPPQRQCACVPPKAPPALGPSPPAASGYALAPIFCLCAHAFAAAVIASSEYTSTPSIAIPRQQQTKPTPMPWAGGDVSESEGEEEEDVPEGEGDEEGSALAAHRPLPHSLPRFSSSYGSSHASSPPSVSHFAPSPLLNALYFPTSKVRVGVVGFAGLTCNCRPLGRAHPPPISASFAPHRITTSSLCLGT